MLPAGSRRPPLRGFSSTSPSLSCPCSTTMTTLGACGRCRRRRWRAEARHGVCHALLSPAALVPGCPSQLHQHRLASPSPPHSFPRFRSTTATSPQDHCDYGGQERRTDSRETMRQRCRSCCCRSCSVARSYVPQLFCRRVHSAGPPIPPGTSDQLRRSSRTRRWRAGTGEMTYQPCVSCRVACACAPKVM